MTKIFAVAALLLTLAQPARAAADPVTVETKWQVKTFAISTTGVTSLTIDLGGFGAVGYAVLGQQMRANGVDGTTYGSASVITSTATNVVGFAYSVLPLGGSASLQVSQTLKTPPGGAVRVSSGTSLGYNSPYPAANAFSVAVLSTSAVITIPNGVPYDGKFQAQTMNPRLIFTGLTAAATLFVTADFGTPRLQ